MSVFTADCPHCGTRSVAFTIRGEVDLGDYYWDTFATCGKCGRGIIATFEVLSGEPPTRAHLSNPRIVPQRPHAGAPSGTPTPVENYFTQARESLHDGRPDAAGLMYRKTLEAALKDKFPDLNSTDNLKARINAAKEQNGITPDMADWAHQIRLGGNDAAHEEEPFSREEADALDKFTELLLRYLFELPGMLQAARDKATTAKSQSQ